MVATAPHVLSPEKTALLRAFGAEVRQVTAVYSDSVQRVAIATSDGRWVEETRPRVRLVVNVVAARDGVIQTGHHGPAGLAGLEFIDANPPAATAPEPPSGGRAVSR